MKKTQFKVEHIEDIEAGKLRIVTEDGREVRLVCKNRKSSNYSILALIDGGSKETCEAYDYDGNPESGNYSRKLYVVENVNNRIKIERGEWYVCIKDVYYEEGGLMFTRGRIYPSTNDRSIISNDCCSRSGIDCTEELSGEYFRRYEGDVLETEKVKKELNGEYRRGCRDKMMAVCHWIDKYADSCIYDDYRVMILEMLKELKMQSSKGGLE